MSLNTGSANADLKNLGRREWPMARIEHYEFGRIVVDGHEERRDLIILSHRVVRNWWWREGRHHHSSPASQLSWRGLGGSCDEIASVG